MNNEMTNREIKTMLKGMAGEEEKQYLGYIRFTKQTILAILKYEILTKNLIFYMQTLSDTK
jgi:uncharacterized protein YfbU (UPF0304 family)